MNKNVSAIPYFDIGVVKTVKGSPREGPAVVS